MSRTDEKMPTGRSNYPTGYTDRVNVTELLPRIKMAATYIASWLTLMIKEVS